MSTPKHTPGPWQLDHGKAAPSGELPMFTLRDADGSEIVGGCGCCESPWCSSEANARLIAAAPELLSVAEAIAAKGSGCQDCQECRAGDIWWDARAALAKATGGES